MSHSSSKINTPMSICWPAFIKLKGDDSLIYISDFAHWRRDPDIHSVNYDDEDVLIDSEGDIYGLNKRVGNQVSLYPTDRVCSIERAIDLVKHHAVQENTCCSAKIHATRFSDVLMMIKSFEE